MLYVWPNNTFGGREYNKVYMVDLLNEKREAVFSPCRKYRYRLSQIWDASKAPLTWFDVKSKYSGRSQK